MLMVRAVASAIIDDALLRRLAAGHRRTVALPREVSAWSVVAPPFAFSGGSVMAQDVKSMCFIWTLSISPSPSPRSIAATRRRYISVR